MELSNNLREAFQEYVCQGETVMSVKMTSVFGDEKFEVLTDKSYYLFDKDMRIVYYQNEEQ